MSDTSQGPGWWLATDHRWYPPTAQPGPPAYEPQYGDDYQDQPRKSRGNLAIPLIVGVVVVAVLIAVGALAGHSSSSGGSAQSGVTAYGQPLTLTLSSFTDPATDSSGYTSDSGNSNDHFAVVKVSTTNNGNSALPATIPITIAAFGTNGQAYERVNETDDGNTLCSYGDAQSLSPSETLPYCAGFVLPENVTVTRVEVSGNQGNGSGTVSWKVTDNFNGSSNSSTAATQPPSTNPTSSSSPTSGLATQLLAPNNSELDWSGFVISPSSCRVVSDSEVMLSGSVTVPSLVGLGPVVGQVEAWATDADGTVASGTPWPIPNATGQYPWTVTVQIAPNQKPTGCEVQGIDPNSSYSAPQ